MESHFENVSGAEVRSRPRNRRPPGLVAPHQLRANSTFDPASASLSLPRVAVGFDRGSICQPVPTMRSTTANRWRVEQAIRAKLAEGHGMLKVVKLVGVGSGTAAGAAGDHGDHRRCRRPSRRIGGVGLIERGRAGRETSASSRPSPRATSTARRPRGYDPSMFRERGRC